ncbi:unnamed protein product [Boreogadus saida]
MLKPGEPSAFLKVDPSYLHHWQQLFPQTPQTPPGQTPSGQTTPGQTPPGRTPPGQTSPGQTPPGQRVSVPGESLRATRLNHHLISSTNCSSTTSSAAPTPSSTSCPSGSSVASSLAGLSQLPVPQHIALFGAGSGDSAAGLHPDPRGLHPEPRDLHSDGPPSCAVVSSSGRSSGGPCPPSCRGRLTSEQLDYYLYGQQRMEIIPLNPHSGDLNHLTHLHSLVRKPQEERGIYDGEGGLQHFVDGNEPTTSGWMRYIRCARHCGEQNMMVVQYRSCIFYRACMDVPRGTELLVWYNDSYTSFFGIPLQCLAQDENLNVPAAVMEAMSRQDSLQTFNKNGKASSPPAVLRSTVFAHSPCSRSFSLMDKAGGPQADSAFGPLGSKNQRVLASPTSTSQLSSEFSDWHLWKCGQCFKTFTQRILLQMHVCTQNPDRHSGLSTHSEGSFLVRSEPAGQHARGRV